MGHVQPRYHGYPGSRVPLKKLSVKHLAIMDYILLNPMLKRNAVAEHFGVGAVWLSVLCNNRMFRAKMAEKTEAMFAQATLSVKEQVQGVAGAALEKLGEQVAAPLAEPEFVRKTAETMLKAMDPGGTKISVQQSQQTVILEGAVAPEVLASARALMAAPVESVPTPELEHEPPAKGEYVESAAPGKPFSALDEIFGPATASEGAV